MKRRFWDSPTYLIPALSVLVLAIVGSAYYFPYIASRQRALDHRAFDILANLADEVSAQTGNYGLVIKQAILRWLPAERANVLPSRKTALAAYLRDQVPGLTEGCDPAPTSKEDIASSLRLQIESHIGSADYDLVYRYQGLCATASVPDLMKPLLADIPESLFDAMFVADDSGQVFYQHSRSGIRIERIDTLTKSAKRDTEPEKADTKSTKPKAPDHVPSPADGNQKASVDISGATFLLYTVPVAIELGPDTVTPQTTQRRKDFIVGALLSEDEYRARSRSFDGFDRIYMAVIPLLIVVAGWPVLKLEILTPIERIPRRIGVWLVYSMMCTVALVTFLVLHSDYHGREESNEPFTNLALAIEGHLRAELQDILRSVHIAEATSEFTGTDLPPAPTTPCSEGSQYQPISRPNILAGMGSFYAWYPFLDQLVWSDRRGYQRIKWTVQSGATAGLCMNQFSWFHEAIQGRYYRFAESSGLDPAIAKSEFRIDPLYSPNTGQYLAIISQPVRSGAAARKGLSVVSTVTPLASLIDAVIPLGFGFAVIQPDGLVLFHSNSARNQRENIYHEIDEPNAMRSAVDLRREGFLSAEYLGVKNRFYIKPFSALREVPWTLVVFQDLSYSETNHIETMMLFGVMLGCYFTFWLVIGLAWSACLPDSPPHWVWPDEARATNYGWLCFFTLVVLLGSLFTWVFEAGRLETELYAVGIPLFSLWYVGSALAGYGKTDSAGKRETLWFGGLSTGVVLAWLLMSSSLSPSLYGAMRRLIWMLVLLLGWRIVLFFRPVLETVGAHAARRLRSATLAVGSEDGSTPYTSVPLFRRVQFVWPVFLYASVTCGLLVITSVLTPVALFRIAYDYRQEVFAAQNQALVFEALERRVTRIERRYQTICAPGEDCSNAESNALAKWFLLRHRAGLPYDRYDTLLSTVPGIQLVGYVRKQTEERWLRPFLALARSFPYPDSWLGTSVSEVAGQLHDTAPVAMPDVPGPEGLKGPVPSAAPQIRVWDAPNMLRTTFGLVTRSSYSAWQGFPELDLLESDRSLLTLVPSLQSLALSRWAMLALVGAGALVWLYRMMSRLFLSNARPLTAWPQLDANKVQEHAILLRFPESGKSGETETLNGRVIDVAQLAKETEETIRGGISALVREGVGKVFVVHFDHQMDDREFNAKKLMLLRGLLHETQIVVVVISTIHPGHYFSEHASEVPEQVIDPGDLPHWDKVLAQFRITGWLAGHGEMPVGYNEGDYRVLWSTRSRRERLVLLQLARDGWANYQNAKAVQHLERWNLVGWTPVIKIRDPHFQAYVHKLLGSPEANLHLAEEKGPREGLRLAVIALAVGFGIILIYAEGQSAAVALTLLTTVTGIIGALSGLGQTLTRSVQPSKPLPIPSKSGEHGE